MLFIRILLVIITIVCLGFGVISPNGLIKINKKIFLTIIPVMLFVGTMCISFIPANTVGIKYSAISGVSQNTLGEGLAFKSP